MLPAEHAAMVVKWRVHILLKSFTVLNTCSIAMWQRHLSFIFILSCYIRSHLSKPEGQYLNTLISTSGGSSHLLTICIYTLRSDHFDIDLRHLSDIVYH